MKDQKRIEWILRIGMFGMFVGHGVFAWQLKPKFIEMLTAMTGFTGTLASNLMVAVGVIDIAIAILVLFYPFRLMLVWASLWGFLTALARPISGDPIWDFIERWVNWAVPLALLYVRGIPKNIKNWFT